MAPPSSPTMSALELVLLLLAASVLVVGFFRSVGLPPILGYLLVGALAGPHALAFIPDTDEARQFAEYGIVFLMFSIGLEFSLPKLFSMKRLVFGLGATQVAVSLLGVIAFASLFGLALKGAIAVGAAVAMSSTAVLIKLLVERMELDSAHGRQVIGVLLFQDLAVVPFLVVIPVLALGAEESVEALALAGVKAAVALTLILYLGPRLMQRWFFMVAQRKSPELFMLNVLLVTLGMAFATELAGLSLALGAFLAGMLISETQYRYQVEEDIKPFRDVLLGLFFVTVGMRLNLALVLSELPYVVLTLLFILTGKFIVAAGAARLFGSSPGNALRVGIWLCAGGEFGFVLMALADSARLIPDDILQIVLAALLLSLLTAPILAHYADRIVLRLVPSEWLLRSMQLTSIAAQSLATDGHAILCGYGRNGQYLGRFLENEGISFIALDLDPERVREAAAAGETVVFGDAAKRETLIAAGLSRASIVVITFVDTEAALRVIHLVNELRADIAVVVRTFDERDYDKLSAAGATEVVPESLESSLMLATHALVLLGVPLHRVLKRIRQFRGDRYHLLRGLYRGAEHLAEEAASEQQHRRLHSVPLAPGSWAIGHRIDEFHLEDIRVEVSAIRRRGIRALEPSSDLAFESGDVVVLLGAPAELARAESRLLKGG
jgi:CPA2 family monovalent cation:H+ antiporter-2